MHSCNQTHYLGPVQPCGGSILNIARHCRFVHVHCVDAQRHILLTIQEIFWDVDIIGHDGIGPMMGLSCP
jgi:hypothetical protein